MEKQIIALLKHSGRMALSDIGTAMRMDKFDTFAVLARLTEHGKITRHENWLTGAQSFSA